MLHYHQQQHKEFKLDILSDETKLSNLIYDSKKTGGLMIGGGISKHHTLSWNQFRGGLDYAAYMTTASEWDGSLCGAPVRETVSWGKVRLKQSKLQYMEKPQLYCHFSMLHWLIIRNDA